MKKLLLLLALLLATIKGFAQADVEITNSNGQNLYVSGASIVYTVIVRNNGPAVATGVQVTSVIPAGIPTSSWSGSNGSFGTNANLNDLIPSLGVNQTVTYTLTLDVPLSFTGALSSVANVSTTSTDPNMANNSATDTDSRATTGADIVITNTDYKSYYFPGTSSLYVITVKNNGPQVAQNVHFMNPKPSSIEVASWYSSNGASGSGNISNEIAQLAVGASVTYYFTINVPDIYAGTLASIATATSTTTDPIPENNTSITDFNVKAVNADVKVSITNNQTIYTPGTTTVYTVAVKNDGPLAATNVNVAGVFPAGITAINWTGTNGSSGTGALNNVIANLPSGNTVTYTVTVQIPSAFTGSLPVQVTATPATADPTMANNTATDTDAQISGANIVVTNTNGQTTYTAGSTTTYTVTVTNQGPEVATNVNVFNAVPNGVVSSSWTGNNGSSGTNTDINDTIPTLAVGASVVYTFIVQIPDNYLGNLRSQTVISGPTFDPFPECANCIDVDTPTVTANANVAVTITDNQNSYVANQTLTYTATVRNNGPAAASNVHVVVPIPAGITNFSWTGSNGSSGTNVGLNNTIETLANGQVITYTIVIQIPAGFSGDLINQISATSSTNDPVLTNNTARDIDTQALTGADIVVTNTNNTGFYIPGTSSVYTITVTNQGPQTAYNILVTNPIPAGITSFSWVGSNGSSQTNLPVSNTINQLNVGDSVTYTVTIDIPVGHTANIVSTATALAQTPSDPNTPNQSVDTDVLGQSDIAVTNTTTQNGYGLGENIVYTVTVTNNGPNAASNVQVENLIPAGITNFSWTGSNGTSGTNVQLNDIIATLATGASVTYTITMGVPATFTGNLVTTATASSAVPDPIAANNTASVTTPLGAFDIAVTNTNGQTVYTLGGTSTYTVTVTNNGPGNANNVLVENLIPAGITSFSWSGNGNSGTDVDLVDTIALLANGNSVTYTITLVVPATFTGNLVSEATATAAGDKDLSNNQAIDTDVNAVVSDVSIVITDNQTEYAPGVSANYTVTVENIGTVEATNIVVNSVVPAGVTNYAWSGNGTNGTGAINNTILSLAAGSSMQYTVSFYVPTSFTSNLATQVAITYPDDDLTNNTSTDTNLPKTGADLVVTNTDNSAIYVAGQSRVYTIQITNYGPQAAQNVVVQNLVPSGIQASTVTWTGNGTNGTGNLLNTIPTLAVGQTVTYTFTVPVPSSFPQNTNLVSEVVVTSDTIDPNPGCTQCVDVDTPTAFADLAVTKSDNRDRFLLSDNTVSPPQTEYTTYFITVKNNGPSDAMNVTIQDLVPNGINNAANVVWNGSNGTSGTGALNQNVGILPAGQMLTYTIVIRMPTSFNSMTGNLVNTVTATTTTTDNNISNNTATDIDLPSLNHIRIEPGKHNPALPVYNVTQLIRDILINEPCVNISNFTASANTAQFGYFHRANTNFPIKEGIILTSGNINTLDSKYNGNSSTAMGNNTPDPDLQMVMTANGLTNLNRDASFVKFDFVPMGSEFSFNFLFASQEYSNFQCSGFYDSFAFVLTNLETGTWENLAVVPVTGNMISVVTIRQAIYANCADMNPTYFGKYNSATNVGTAPTSQANVDASHINLRGQTVKMKAATTVIPGKPYSIKLISADASDQILDTAVFIEAGSFNIGGPKITGTGLYADDEDFSGPNAICEGTTRIIRAAPEANPDINYVWYKDDVVIPGANQHFIEVSEPGVYKVVFNFITMNCSQSDFIIVDFTPPPFAVEEATDLYVCNDATPEFDLTVNKDIVLANFASDDFDAYYYNSASDAELGENGIPAALLQNYPGVDGETIYIKVVNMFTGGYCDPIKPFQLFLTDAPTGGFSYPDDGGAPGYCIGSSTSMLPIAPGLTPGGTYSSTPPGLTIVDPATGEINVNTSLEGTYTVIYEFTGMGCPDYTSLPVEVIISPCVATIPGNSGPVCEGTPTFNLTATDAGVGATYEWTDYNGVVFSTDQNPTGIIVPATPGTYVYTVVATIGTSSSSPVSTTLTVYALPEAEFVFTSGSVCTNDPANLILTGTPGATATINDGSADIAVVLDAAGNGQYTTPALTADATYTLIKVTSNTTPACEYNVPAGTPNSAVTITVGLPSATMVGFTDAVICSGTTGTFTIQGTPNAVVDYTIDTVAQAPVTIPASGILQVVTPVQNFNATTVFTYELTSITSSGASPCSDTITGESATLTVNALPTASFTTTTPTVCEGTPGTIEITGTPGASVIVNDGSSDLPAVTLDASGSYTLATANLNDPLQTYTYTLVSASSTSTATCTAPLTGSLTISVDANPAFVSISPATGTVLCIGDTVNLSVVATGANLSYQWYKDGTTPVGTDSATFTIPSASNADAGDYTVEISGSCGTAVMSTVVALVVNQPTVITDEPDNATVCQGQPVTLEVTATGVSLSYQWYKGTVLLTGETSPILNIASATLADAGTYNCVITNPCPQVVTSQNAVVVVNELPSIVSYSPSPAPICAGQAITLTVQANGTNLSYQWKRNGGNIAGATSSTYNDPSVTMAEAGNYTVEVSGTCAPSVESGIITVVVNEGATLTQDTQVSPSDTVCSGESITLSVITSGGTNVTYQWQRGGVNIAGATSPTLNIAATAVSDTGIYTCVISSDSCPSFSSAPLAVTVDQAPVVTDDPDTAVICVGTTHHLTVQATGTNVTYQWYRNSIPLAGATSNVYTITSATVADSGDYYCEVGNASCPSRNSGIATLTVRPLPVATIANGATSSICSGESSEIVFQGTPGAMVVYNIVGAQSNETVLLDVLGQAVVATGTLTSTTVYELVSVTYTGANACSQPLAGSVTVTVNELPEVAIEDGYICVDSVTNAVTRTYILDTGLNTGQYIFEWSDVNGVIPGASNSFYEASAVGQYAVKVTNSVTLCEESAFANVYQSSPPTSFDYTVNGFFADNPTVVITAQPAGDYEYQLDYGPFQDSNTFDGISTGIHTITVRDPQGCDVLTKEVTIIDYPKYFTPNGDGYNDTWNISEFGEQLNAKIYIFDRFGKLVKEISTKGLGWDGTFNGQPLPATDYWFTLDYEEKGIRKEFKAHFSLKR